MGQCPGSAMTEMSRRDFIQSTGVVRGISQVSGLLRFRADLLAKGCPWVFRSWADAMRMRQFLERRPRLTTRGRGIKNGHRCEPSCVSATHRAARGRG